MATIYKITNLITNKIYIGETNRTLDVRWKQHQYRAKDPSNMEYLYNSMRKYGIDNFKIEKIEDCDATQRFERETYYILKFNSMAPNGYNLVLSQNGPTQEMIGEMLRLWNEGLSIVGIGNRLHMDPKTISLYIKNHGISQDEIFKRRSKNIGKYSSKAVIQYSLQGEYLNSWDSASAAARETNLNRASISKCCNEDMLTYKGFIWQYKDSDDIENIVEIVKTKNKTGINEKPILCYDLDGNLIKEYPSASAAGRDFGVAHAGIAYAARNGTKSNGFYWKYKT